jgi:hypothetical protein
MKSLKTEKRHKTVEIMVFLSIVLLVDGRICIRESKNLRILIRNTFFDASKHVPVQSFIHKNGHLWSKCVYRSYILIELFVYFYSLSWVASCMVPVAPAEAALGIFSLFLCDIPFWKRNISLYCPLRFRSATPNSTAYDGEEDSRGKQNVFFSFYYRCNFF